LIGGIFLVIAGALSLTVEEEYEPPPSTEKPKVSISPPETEKPGVARCQSCGSELSENEKFCRNCGAEV
ncbi:MAG: zinc ribbon domain-containing protein, partial [Candidatus Odinarchaeota archaeon]